MIVEPSKMAPLSLPPLVNLKDLGQRPGRHVAFKPLNGARADYQHPMGRLAAQHLLPGVGDNIELGPNRAVLGKSGRGGIANGQAFTVRRQSNLHLEPEHA